MRPLILAAALLFAAVSTAAAATPDTTIKAQAHAFLRPCSTTRCFAGARVFTRDYLLAIHGSASHQLRVAQWFGGPFPQVVAPNGRQFCAWLWIYVDRVGAETLSSSLSTSANSCDNLPAAAHARVWRRYQTLRREIAAVTAHDAR